MLERGRWGRRGRDFSRAGGGSMTADKCDVLVLRLLEQKDNQEIARVPGIRANTVAARYRRALEELRRCVPDVYREVRLVSRSA